MPAFQNPQYRSNCQDQDMYGRILRIALICPNFLQVQRGFPRKLLGCLGYTIALRSGKCSCFSHGQRIPNKPSKLAHVWHHQSSMEQLRCPCELTSIEKVLSTSLGTEGFSDQTYTSQKISFSYFFYFFFYIYLYFFPALSYCICSSNTCLF